MPLTMFKIHPKDQNEVELEFYKERKQSRCGVCSNVLFSDLIKEVDRTEVSRRGIGSKHPI